jgi:hypothetical protein
MFASGWPLGLLNEAIDSVVAGMERFEGIEREIITDSGVLMA